jgi:hypothetical protein
MPPSYVKGYVKRSKNDAADAAAICEAVTRPSMRFAALIGPAGARPTCRLRISISSVLDRGRSVDPSDLLRDANQPTQFFGGEPLVEEIANNPSPVRSFAHSSQYSAHESGCSFTSWSKPHGLFDGSDLLGGRIAAANDASGSSTVSPRTVESQRTGSAALKG